MQEIGSSGEGGTSEERREIAENLRHLTIGHSIQYKEQFFNELAEVVVGFEDYHDFDVVLDKLADLIDPEGETTWNTSAPSDTIRTQATLRKWRRKADALRECRPFAL